MRRFAITAIIVLLAGCTTAQTSPTASPTEIVTPSTPAPTSDAASPASDATTPTPENSGTADDRESIPVATSDPSGAAVPTDDAGNTVRAIGETSGLTSPDGGVLFEVTIRDARWEESCPSRSGGTASPEVGTFLVLDVVATLSESYAENMPDVDDPFIPVVPDFFTATDGSAPLPSHSDAAFGCYDAELITPFVEPGATSEGLVVLDVSRPHAASVIYDPFGTGGWAWELP